MRERQGGQSTVEFGISAVVLLLLLLGLIDFGRVFYFVVGMQGAVREGARQATWFDSNSSTNPYLYDGAIKAAVDGVLTNSGLPASQLQNSTTTCPSVTDGNANHNPPYAASAYPSGSLNQPLLYICYENSPGVDITTAPTDNGYKGQDVNVILVMSYGFGSSFMQNAIGPSVDLVANTHMTVGGY
jgi:Flp pilus assembly protein TadG